MHTDKKRTVVEVTIAESATLSPVGGHDIEGYTIVGVKCPASVNSETALTFLFAPGKAGAYAGKAEPTTPDADGDYDDLEDDAGSAITIAIADGVTRTFSPAVAGIFMNATRFARLEVSGGAPSGGLTFGLILREI